MSTIFGYISNPWLYWSLVIIYGVTIFTIVGIILSENRNPLKSLAWVTVLLLLPVLGIILYIFFGRNIKNKRMISRRNKKKLQRQGIKALHVPLPASLSTESKQQIRLARSLSGAPYFPGNEIEIFNKGIDKFESLLNDIKNAKEYIHLQYYIIEDDETGNRLAEALMERARAGVKVRIIYDSIGSYHTKKKFFKRLEEAGIEAHPFFKVTFRLFATRINWRNHRKLCIIDGEVGYIGGMNIADRYIYGPAKDRIWRDTHLRIKGPALAALQYSFAVDWSFMGNGLLEEDVKDKATPDAEGAGVQMLTSGPTSQWSEISFSFFKAIANAKQRIYIQTPYFLPTEALLKALQSAALSKVDVRVMIPEKSDSWILTSASSSYVRECLDAGIKIYFYQAGMLHGKTMLIDDEFVTVGSTNFDFRSFEHNFESNLFIYSREFNARMVENFREDMKSSRRVSSAQWRKRPRWNKIKESIVRLLSPIL